MKNARFICLSEIFARHSIFCDIDLRRVEIILC